jgi:hypothetical protein
MSPAFSSSRQAAAFALLLAVLLALPAVMARTGRLDRRDVYPAIADKYGPFPWIQQQVFTEAGDADLVFLGSSHLWNAVDTPYVQRALSARLGREAEVFTLGWPWPGFDAAYVLARDLLDRRRVHTLVIYDEQRRDDSPHQHSSRWFRIGDLADALQGLPWSAQASLYGGSVLGMPRQLLSLVRPNLVEDPRHAPFNYWHTHYAAANLADQRGALKARLAFKYSHDFDPYRPPSVATPADVRIYSAETQGAFAFRGSALPPYQRHFARKLAQLCHSRGTQLIVLHVPVLAERGQPVITERVFWPEVLGAPAEVVGIPPARLFAGIPSGDLTRLFYDEEHFNQNGQELFTPLITPALVHLFARSDADHPEVLTP